MILDQFNLQHCLYQSSIKLLTIKVIQQTAQEFLTETNQKYTTDFNFLSEQSEACLSPDQLSIESPKGVTVPMTKPSRNQQMGNSVKQKHTLNQISRSYLDNVQSISKLPSRDNLKGVRKSIRSVPPKSRKSTINKQDMDVSTHITKRELLTEPDPYAMTGNKFDKLITDRLCIFYNYKPYNNFDQGISLKEKRYNVKYEQIMKSLHNYMFSYIAKQIALRIRNLRDRRKT